MSDNKNKRVSPEDTFKILVATDCHLGYEQSKKRAQSNDSFTTFEEILKYAKDYDVDFILLGGDLFHDSKPSQITVLKCMDLLRKYCLGPRKNKIQFLSEPSIVFEHCLHKTVNYEDPNLNVSIPVFSIHGNHDDPSFGTIGSLDLLSVSGLVNYFGKWTDLTKITIPPLLFKKGDSHIALYGLSYINDQRLSRLLRDLKIDMLRPKEITDCFNIFVLHQNRTKHAEYAYIPENKLPNFLNLIIWGHEHECRISPEFVEDNNYYICQPGSSVATSLCEAEAVPKHVALLSINKLNFKINKLKLKTVRPFVFDNLILRDEKIKTNYAKRLSDCIYEHVDNYIENKMIPEAANQLTGHPQQPHQPLLRLRIFYTDEDQVFEMIRISQKYCDEVANPMDIIIFRKEKSTSGKHKLDKSDNNDEVDDAEEAFGYGEDEKDWSRSVQGGIRKYFESKENKDKLTVLSVTGLNEALFQFVEKDDNDAFQDVIRHQIKKNIEHLRSLDVETPEDIYEEIRSFRDERYAKEKEEEQDVRQMLDNKSRKVRKTGNSQQEGYDIDLDDEIEEVVAETGRGRATNNRGSRVRARGTRGRGRGRGRGKSTENIKNALDVTITSSHSAIRQPRRARGSLQSKEVQSTLQSYIQPTSSQSSTKHNLMFFEDSD